MTKLNSEALADNPVISVDTVRIIPERIDPEWLELVYKELTEEGRIEVDNFLTLQDLEINDEGIVSFIPLTYTLPQTSGVTILFADGHTEEWKVEYLMDRKLVFTDLKGNRYDTLYSLRPTDKCSECEIIVAIELHETRNIIGF